MIQNAITLTQRKEKRLHYVPRSLGSDMRIRAELALSSHIFNLRPVFCDLIVNAAEKLGGKELKLPFKSGTCDL